MLNEVVIGTIGKWWVLGREQEPFYGQLKQEPGGIFLCTEMVSTERYVRIAEKRNFLVYGQVGGNKITLRGTNVDERISLITNGEIERQSICLIFEECFIGNDWVPEMVVVKSAYVKYDGIGAWFQQNSYQEHVPFSQDAVLLSFQQHNPLSFTLGDFDLKFDFGLSYSHTEWNRIEYTNWINTVFSPKQCPLGEFCERVNQFSQLLSMFSYGKVRYSSIMIETTAGFSGEYLMNPPVQAGEPAGFWLTYPQIADSLEAVLQNWFCMAAKAQPILGVFMQVLDFTKPGLTLAKTVESASGSHFLCAVQALEMYSNYFRAAQAKQYAEKTSDLPEGEDVPVELRHKLCDLFQDIRDILGFSDIELWKIANKIAASYEYYFRYNPDRKYDALTTEQTASLLMFAQEALKASLLKEIGVPEDVLEKAEIHITCHHAIYPWILKVPQISAPSGLAVRA